MSGPLVLRRQVGERTRSPKCRRQRLKSFGPRLSSFENSKDERQDKKDRATQQEGESGLEEDWNMDCEEEVENRKKLGEQRKWLQKQLRDLEKFTCMPQDIQSRLKEEWQQQLQDIEQKRNDLLPEHQRVQKRSQKIQSIQDKKRNMLKETVAAEEDMRKVRAEVNERELRFHQLSRKVDSIRMATAELEAELRGLQAGEERRGSNASQVVAECCLDTVAEQPPTTGAVQAKLQLEVLFEKILKRFEARTPPAQMPVKRRRKRGE